MTNVRTIGILGAGKLGIVLSQLALKAGYNVYVSGSGDPEKIRLSVKVLAPGAVAATSEEVVKESDVVILAFPLSKYRNIPVEALADKLIIDATNYWWEVDGAREDFLNPEESSSMAIQKFLSKSRVVKALNHMGYHDLYDETRPAGAAGRKAIAVAGDDEQDIKIVSDIVDTLGFDPVCIGNLASGVKLEPGGKVFGANEDAETLTDLLKAK
ncbi:MAG TPA: NAD(P)-binding domain-containing protein [Candidatus Saccharimonadales bacterium]